MSKIPDVPTDAPALDSDSMAAIRAMMATEVVPPTPSAAASEAVPETVARIETAPSVAPSAPEVRSEGRTRACLPPLAAAEEEGGVTPEQPAPKKRRKPRKTAAGPGLFGRARARVMGYRPTARHIVLACLGLVLLFRPWLMLAVVFLGLFLVLGVFLALGYDRFWRSGMAFGRWYAARRPARAAEVHARLDAFAMKWDAVLDRFPEGTVDGLYLPDFGEMAAADARHEAALDRRLEGLRESEV